MLNSELVFRNEKEPRYCFLPCKTTNLISLVSLSLNKQKLAAPGWFCLVLVTRRKLRDRIYSTDAGSRTEL